MPKLPSFYNPTPPSEIYTLSLHDALPISTCMRGPRNMPELIASRISTVLNPPRESMSRTRSEEHTSELQSLRQLVCRLLLEKKKHTPPASINAKAQRPTCWTHEVCPPICS